MTFSFSLSPPSHQMIPFCPFNSFYCHKQFKFLIFTQKYLRSIDVSASKVEIYYRMVQLDVKSSCAVEIPTGFSGSVFYSTFNMHRESFSERIPNLHFKLSFLDVISVHKFQIFLIAEPVLPIYLLVSGKPEQQNLGNSNYIFYFSFSFSKNMNIHERLPEKIIFNMRLKQ